MAESVSHVQTNKQTLKTWRKLKEGELRIFYLNCFLIHLFASSYYNFDYSWLQKPSH